MSHPFGDLLTQFLHRRHGLSQSRLAAGISMSPSIISEMCTGKRLTGPQARERVVAIIGWLVEQGALDTLDHANALLTAAGMAALQAQVAAEARLIARLREPARAQPTAPPLLRVERHAQRYNLPAQTTSFIGHEHELSELRRQLAPGGTRLLTLTGSGGVGKTRLALQLAGGFLNDYPDGVWFVEFASQDDPALVPQAVAVALGNHEEPGRAILATLVDHLRECELLLLLDNCEHLIDAVARLAAALLSDCPHLRILATSREGLVIPGEQVWRVHSLELPAPHQQIGLAELAQYEAVRLFVERTRAVSPTFALTAQNAQTVRKICARLDGIPLAIELAAARVNVLSVEDIAARLDDRFRLLASGSRTAPPRQQTLRGTIDWSYDLLSELERSLLRRLAVFAGGWTLEAAETVCSGAGVDPAAVLDVLAGLVNKSLVIAVNDAGGIAGLTRYHFLETLRHYAGERLTEAGEEARVRENHLAYFIASGDTTALEWAGTTPRDAAGEAKRLAPDMDNLRHALDWADQAGRVDDAIHLLEAYWQNLFVVVAVDMELLRRLQRLVAHPAAVRTVRLGRAYLMLWELYFGQEAFEQASAANERAREIGLALGNPAILVRADYQLALQAQERGDYALARSIFDRLRAADEQMSNDWLWIYGILALYEGDYPLARDQLLEFYTMLHARTSNKAHTAGGGRLLGYALAYLGDYTAAATLLRDSLLDNREMGDERAVAASLAACGALALAQGELGHAARLLGASEGLIQSIHDYLQYFDRMLFRRSVAALREQLDAATLGTEWATGRALTQDQAVAYALDEARRSDPGDASSLAQI